LGSAKGGNKVGQAFRLKRVYDPAEREDGLRVLVDRLWPRGMRKEEARVDIWMKDIAPSPALRQWFGHRPERFEEFGRRYQEELQWDTDHRECVKELMKHLEKGTVTLLYAARDEIHNHAVILKQYLDDAQK